MRVLILGGTKFLGVHLVEEALQRGHAVTLFHRGKTNPDLFPDLEHIYGDRDGGLDVLASRQWDAVIDTCGFAPRVVDASARLLAQSIPHYTFISTLNVYADVITPGADEQALLAPLQEETEEVTGTTYGPLKALCEQVVQAAYPEGALIIRAGLIVGPRDLTSRFTYWPHRFALGGEVLAPDHKDQPVQCIDVRDMAAWIIRMVEARRSGAYNTMGPAEPLMLQQLLEQCNTVCGNKATITWVEEVFLTDKEVQPWSDLPLYIPTSSNEDGFLSMSNRKALAAGLTFRPLAETIQDTLAWDAAHPEVLEQGSSGLKPERESSLLQAWHQQHNTTK